MHENRKVLTAALLIFLSLVVGFQLSAQTTEEVFLQGNKESAQKTTDEYSKKTNEESSQKKKNFRVSPFVAPGYTPELGFVLAGGALFSFSTDFADEDLPRSSISTAFSYGFKGSFVISALANTYWLNDKLRVPIDLWFKDMPDQYWGVGFDAARNTLEGTDTTAYDRFWWQVNPKILWQFQKNLFAGLNLDFNQTVASDMSAGVASDSYIQAQGTDNYNGGAGFIFMHDSRDVPVNAYSGWYLSGSATFYGRYLGSDNVYQIYDIDYRQYQQIVRPGSTLVWQIHSRIGSGDVPWPEMTQIGNPFNLRGYYWGQYRDVAGTYGILEYRFKFMTNKQTRFRPEEGRKESRHGFVVWAGLGAIGNDFGAQWGNWMPNTGFGYRFEVQERSNARIDFGWGRETFGIYFNFNEAF